jgi:hypothetical protein
MSHFHQRFLSLLGLLALLAAPLSARAHESVTLGDYVVEYGWETEPPVEGQANAIVLTFAHGAPDDNASIRFTNPQDGSMVDGDAVTVELALSDPEHTHAHLYLGDQLLAMGEPGDTHFQITGLPNGAHTLKAATSDDITHLEAHQMATVTITVMNSTAPANSAPVAAAEGDTGGHGHGEMGEMIDVSALTVELVYGGQTTALTLTPRTDNRNAYRATFTPGRAGLYTLRFGGHLDGHAVSAEVNPEEVAQSAANQSQSASSAGGQLTLIIVGVIVVLALVGGGVFWFMRKK